MGKFPTINILIITALAEELDALTSHFNLQKQPSFLTTSTPYYINSDVSCTSGIVSYSVAVICLNTMGNTNAGIDVTNALRDLSPSYVFMFGIAGGIKDEVNLTDVIIPDNIFYFGLGKHRSTGIEIRPETLRTNTFLLQRLRAYMSQVENNKPYKVKIGPLAVGEHVIANNDAFTKLRCLHPKLLGIEMESYGAGLAVFKQGNAQFVAIRGVSDHADEHKSDDYRVAALENAADFLVGFIKAGLLPKQRLQNHAAPKFIAIHHISLYRRPSIMIDVENYLTDLQVYDVIEMPIDQVDFYKDGSLTSPLDALAHQKNLLHRLENILKENPDCILGYFGLAHIPMVFHLGYELNRREVQVFGNGHNSGRWFELSRNTPAPEIMVSGFPEGRVEESGDVILLVSVSSKIVSAEPSKIAPRPLATIHIRAKNPYRGLIKGETELNEFTSKFREVIEKINEQFPSVKRVHLFFAGQPTLAFRCGQQINRNMDPEIVVYNYSKRDQPHYRWGLNLQTCEIIERA